MSACRPCRHQHGTRQRASRRGCHPACTCLRCRAAWACYQRELVAARRSDRPPKTATGPAGAHIGALNRAGLTYTDIARLAGVGKDTLTRIRNAKPGSTMYTFTAELILAVPVPAPAPDPTVGTVRRLQALAAVGWPLRYLSARLGLDRDATGRIIAGRRATSPALARQIRDLYEQLYATDGPSPRVAARAGRLRWAPPHAWPADTDLDDPAARPTAERARRSKDDVDPENVRRLCDGTPPGNTTPGEHRAAVTELAIRGGLSDGQIAARTGLTERHVHRLRTEMGLPAYATAMRAAMRASA